VCASEHGEGAGARTREDDACSAESGLSGWAPVPSMWLADKGTSLLLRLPDAAGRSSGAGYNASSDSAPVPLAVRFQWRAFPCERLGCGVYATAGDAISGPVQVPPPPFYARLLHM
jgi:hypothetical protein